MRSFVTRRSSMLEEDRPEPVPVIELLAQLLESVELLASPAEAQLHWLDCHGFPMQELILDLELCWPLFSERLLDAGLIDHRRGVSLDRLVARAIALVNPAHAPLFTEEQLNSAQEWADLRKQAALVAIDLRASLA